MYWRAYLYHSEDCTEPDSGDKDEEEDAMKARMALRVEDGQKEQTHASDERGYDGEDGQHTFSPTHLCNQATARSAYCKLTWMALEYAPSRVPQPSLNN